MNAAQTRVDAMQQTERATRKAAAATLDAIEIAADIPDEDGRMVYYLLSASRLLLTAAAALCRGDCSNYPIEKLQIGLRHIDYLREEMKHAQRWPFRTINSLRTGRRDSQ